MKNLFFLALFTVLSSCSTTQRTNRPLVALYPLGNLEGLSGLSLQETTKENDLIFWSHTDRGPNATEIMDKELGQKRPFINPDFKPYWVQFSVNRNTKEFKLLRKIELNLSGLPNTKADELPVNGKGDVLKRDLMGIDPEAICFDGKNVWMAEEYRPSILKFDLDGNLLRRFVPEGSFTQSEMILPALQGKVFQKLPARFKERKLNRGFEGLACTKNKVYAILQSPLPKDPHQAVMVEFDSLREEVIREYKYPLEPSADKIGDLVLSDDNFYVIEQSGGVGPGSFHRVYQFDLKSAQQGILQKVLKVDLVKAGYDFADKVEGLAVLKDGAIAIVNDNDFGVNGDTKTIMGISGN